MLKEAQELLTSTGGTIKSLRDSLVRERAEKAELMSKVASMSRQFEFHKLVDDMIAEGIIGYESKGEKLEEMLKSGYDPIVYREAVNIAAGMTQLGKLSDQEELEKSAENPLDDVLISFIRNKKQY
jgi:hypothetical protein